MNILEELKIESDTFYKILEYYLPEKKNLNLEILNIECGTINEEPAILDYFGPLTNLKSIDRESSLESKTKIYSRKSFHLMDIKNLNPSERFDLIISRNMDFGFEVLGDLKLVKNPFIERFFKECGKYLNPQGITLFTFPFEYNYINGKESLSGSFVISKMSGINKYPILNNGIGSCIWTPEQNDYGRHFKDEYILIAKKK